MRKKLPAPGNGRSYLEIAILAFGLGILLAFFLSSKALVLIEALLILVLGALCFTEH